MVLKESKHVPDFEGGISGFAPPLGEPCLSLSESGFSRSSFDLKNLTAARRWDVGPRRKWYPSWMLYTVAAYS